MNKDVEYNIKKDLTNNKTSKRIREEVESTFIVSTGVNGCDDKYDENNSNGAHKLRLVDENVVQNKKTYSYNRKRL